MLVIHTSDDCRAYTCISMLEKYILLSHIRSMREYCDGEKYTRTHVEFLRIFVFSTPLNTKTYRYCHVNKITQAIFTNLHVSSALIMKKCFISLILFLKNESRLMQYPCCLCVSVSLWISPINLWMPDPIFVTLHMCIMAPEPISTEYFINPSHQSVFLYL
jgi:hypothetical protein